MPIHFTPEEFAGRRERTCAALRRAGLDGLLMFRQESMYYLTGYDSFGYCFFQCLVLTADGRFVLLTRAPDLRQARHTSVIENIRIWVDGAGHNPAHDLEALLRELGLAGTRLGIEYDAYGLTAYSWRQMESVLPDFCRLEDASRLVDRQRMVKSPAEMVYVQRAAELADRALEAGLAVAAPGVDEAGILAAMQAAVLAGGGDYPGNEFIIGSGRDALLCRYHSGRRRLDARDQLTLEFAGVYRRYHAALMRTVPIGAAAPEHIHMHAVAIDALEACMAALRPGEPLGAVFDAHARVVDAAGYRHARLNACGYSMGAVYAPSWMDWPMLYTGNGVLAEPGMVLFLHMILMDSERGYAMTPGQTVRVTERGCESLHRVSMEMTVR
ncbi:MAG: Xaa-Pro peptidase family protein [Candidatus Competibacterales bacterium]|nr:Xaa-Pro peptidase family protein [Candidatus Competibacterales bacterium]